MPLTFAEKKQLQRCPPVVQAEYQAEVNQLDEAFSKLNEKIKHAHKTDRKAMRTRYEEALDELKIELYMSTMLYHDKDTEPDMTGDLMLPALMHTLVENTITYLTFDGDNEQSPWLQQPLPFLYPMIAAAFTSYLRLGRFIFPDTNMTFTAIRVKILQQLIQKYFPNTVAHHTDLLFIFYSLWLHLEKTELIELVVAHERYWQDTRRYIVGTGIGAVVHNGLGTTMWGRLASVFGVGGLNIYDRHDKCGPNLMALANMHNNIEPYFLKVCWLALQIYLDGQVLVKRPKIEAVIFKLPATVIAQLYAFILEHKYSNETPQWVIENQSAYKKLEKTLKKAQAEPASKTAVKSVTLPPLSAHSVPFVRQVAKKSSPTSRSFASKDIAAFQERCAGLITSYKKIRHDYRASIKKGWLTWLFSQITVLQVCAEFLESIGKSNGGKSINIDDLNFTLEKYISVMVGGQHLTLEDWKISDAIKDFLKPISQQHFQFILDMALYFQTQKNEDYATWLSGLYPYLPKHTKESLHLRQLAFHLFEQDIVMFEVGSRIYWPKLAEDIDLCVFSETKSHAEVARAVNYLNQYGWYIAHTANHEICTTSIYKHAHYKSIDVVINHDPRFQKSMQSSEERKVNIAATEANLVTSCVRFTPEFATSISKGEIECMAGVEKAEKTWPIVTKSYWKMQFNNQESYRVYNRKDGGAIPLYSIGKHLENYIDKLYCTESQITLFHLLELVNKSTQEERIWGLWGLFTDIMGTEKFSLYQPKHYDSEKKAKHCLNSLLQIKDLYPKGWLLLLLHTLDCTADFYKHSKLGLLPEQVTMMQRLQAYCLALSENPYVSLPKLDGCPKFANVLARFCKQYFTEPLDDALAMKAKQHFGASAKF